MTTATPTQVSAHTLDAPGVTLYYELRGSGPLLVLVGAPLDASAFAPLATSLADTFTVLTTDPRGISRSVLEDPDQDSTPVERADDLHRIMAAVGRGRARVFGSSGGAATALALAERHPGDVHLVVAHEPPLPVLLDDRDELLAAADDIRETFLAEGQGPAWGKFMVLGGFTLPEPDDGADEGMPEPDEHAEANGAYMLGHMLAQGLRYEPDFAALRGTRIVVGVGAESTGQLCHRTATAAARSLGVPVTEFPGDHGGFFGEQAVFAERLRDVLES